MSEKHRTKFNPPTVPAIYALENEVYHDSEGLSSSGLKLFMQAPIYYFDKYMAEDREPTKQTPALVLGTQIHTAVLEPDRYFQDYYPLPEKYDLRTKAGKADYEYHEAKAKAEGKTLISAESHDICQRIAEAIHKSAAAEFFFTESGEVEQSYYWLDEKTGVLCKIRPDKLLTNFPIVLDLKSSDDCSPNSFSRDIYNYGYHISAEFYRRGVKAVTGRDIESFIWPVFEKSRPYACAFYSASPEMLAKAAEEIDAALVKFAECMETGVWEGYPDEVQEINLPVWVK